MINSKFMTTLRIGSVPSGKKSVMILCIISAEAYIWIFKQIAICKAKISIIGEKKIEPLNKC